MKRILLLVAASSAFILGGCGPKGSTPPPAPKKDAATVQREWLYGARAAATEIVWQPSGLGIRMLASGEGSPPKSTDRVRVHFKCVLKDGTVVDDSQARGGPVDLTVNRLIPGWAESMAALRPGGRAEFFIPPSLGYGMSGGAGIPAGSGLIFEVELLAVTPETPLEKKP
ncbi:MAG: FKBP-type peptidyl-prolyl cis-trans isomerase [Opitutaceae bacterium]